MKINLFCASVHTVWLMNDFQLEVKDVNHGMKEELIHESIKIISQEVIS